MPKKRRNVEDAIQRELLRWIKENYPHVKVFATRNEDSRNRPDEIEAGIPDVIARWMVGDVRHFLYLEVKTKKGTLQKNQKEWAAEPRANNEYYGVGYGLAECKKVIIDTL